VVVRAVDDIDFSCPRAAPRPVGESGCGKPTTARLLMIDARAGDIIFDGEAWGGTTG
jgi:ABC-type oligopeptide transport system ATPase subunit